MKLNGNQKWLISTAIVVAVIIAGWASTVTGMKKDIEKNREQVTDMRADIKVIREDVKTLLRR